MLDIEKKDAAKWSSPFPQFSVPLDIFHSHLAKRKQPEHTPGAVHNFCQASFDNSCIILRSYRTPPLFTSHVCSGGFIFTVVANHTYLDTTSRKPVV